MLKKIFFRKRRKNESWLRYISGLLHLWLGIITLPVVFTVCFTGALYAFKNQVWEFANRDKVFIAKGQKSLPVEKLATAVFKNSEKINSVSIPDSKNKSWIFSGKISEGKTQIFYINPFTAKNLGSADSSTAGFFDTVLDIHKNLLLGKAGKQIVGASVLGFLLILASGFILWLPKKLNYLRQALTVKFSGKFLRINHNLHTSAGFYACISLFFIALTGVYITYPWMKAVAKTALSGSSEDITEAKQDDSFAKIMEDMLQREDEKKEKTEAVPLSKIISESNRALPYRGTLSVVLPDKENPRYTVTKLNSDNFLGAIVPDELTFDRAGNLKTQELFRDKTLYRKFTAISKPLHTGEILGLKSIIFYFIIVLVGCLLPVTGTIIWLHRIKKQLK